MAEQSRKWSFPPKRCPRCKRIDSEPTHTDSERGIQYRRCRTPLCRAIGIRFSVQGVPTEPTDPGSPAPGPVLRCPHCDKTYQRQADLTRHIHKHHQTGEPNGSKQTQ